MTHATAPIPDPPRAVRWRTCLACRWPLGLIGGVVSLEGLVLVAVMLATGLGGPLFADTKLDSGASKTAGRVTAVRMTEPGSDGPPYRIEFEFELPDKGRFRGTSYTAGELQKLNAAGDCTVEFWPADPRLCRLQGTACLLYDPQLSLLSNLLLVPGLIAFFLWLRGVLRLRIALREGVRTDAQVIEAKKLGYVNPGQVRVHYRFQDERAGETIATHWVRAGSPLGRHLLEDRPRVVPVIYDEDVPARSRVVGPADFLAAEAAESGETGS